MPLLMCPNCQTEMKEINRQGVQIDMCAQCQGVWLDRGELNKLLEVSRQDVAEAQSFSPLQAGQPRHETHYPPHGKYRKKSRLESLFDMFD